MNSLKALHCRKNACPWCAYAATDPRDLRCHTRSCASKPSMTFPCSICSCVFVSSQGLQIHQRSCISKSSNLPSANLHHYTEKSHDDLIKPHSVRGLNVRNHGIQVSLLPNDVEVGRKSKLSLPKCTENKLWKSLNDDLEKCFLANFPPSQRKVVPIDDLAERQATLLFQFLVDICGNEIKRFSPPNNAHLNKPISYRHTRLRREKNQLKK